MTARSDYQEIPRSVTDALYGRNARDFYNACNRTGYNPSVLGGAYVELYEQGKFELSQERGRNMRAHNGRSLDEFVINFGRGRKRKVPNETYLSFLDGARELRVPTGDFISYSDTKRRLLIKYLPDRFGEGKKQDLGRYEDGQIGFLFSQIIDYAKRIEREKSESERAKKKR